jgi:acyl dehydratase
MPIDVPTLLAGRLGPVPGAWDASAVILYHLGIGAGLREDHDDLRYLYEGGLQVLPTFAVIPPIDVLNAVLELPGLDIDPAQVLHGEQVVVLDGPLPAEAAVTHTGRVVQVWDKSHAALLVVEVETHDAADARRLFINRYALFIRGEGGFGGDSGPKSGPPAPERAPDRCVDVATLANQAALYRLNGDRNPLHIDPEFAKRGGFDRPILHGMCTYGIAGKAVVDEMLGGDAARVRRIFGRLAGVVFPGERLRVEMWDEPSGVAVRMSVPDAGRVVLSHAGVERTN